MTNSKQDFQYSDGEDIEVRIKKLIENSSNRSSDSFIGLEQSDNWAVRYHLCPERSNLVRPLNWSGLSVLEVGAGLGAVSRYLAENSAKLTVLEGSGRRLEAAKARLKDLANWDAYEGNFSDFNPDLKYDVVTSIGVLEYSKTFYASGGKEAPGQFIRKAKSCLKPGGVFVIAIENKTGLKYWAGCPEDHDGRLFSGISGYSDFSKAETFSKKEIENLLIANGFGSVRFFYPFPDYKMPRTILSDEIVNRDPVLASNMVGDLEFETKPFGRIRTFPEALVLKEMAKAGLLADFSNSFLIFASEMPLGESQVARTLFGKVAGGEWAWKYNNRRKNFVSTIFTSRGAFVKHIGRPSNQDFGRFLQAPFKEEVKVPGEPVIHFLKKHLYSENWAGFENLFYEFLENSLRIMSTAPGKLLHGQALDATFGNANIDEHGKFHLFDLEWSISEGVSAQWYIFRNVLIMHSFRALFCGSPFRSLEDIFRRTCARFGLEPEKELCILNEADFQSSVNLHLEKESAAQLVRAAVDEPFERELPYIRGLFDHEPFKLRKDLDQTRYELNKLQSEINEVRESRSWRWTKPLRFLSNFLQL